MASASVLSTSLEFQASEASVSPREDQGHGWDNSQWISPDSDLTIQLTKVTPTTRYAKWFSQAFARISELQKLKTDWDTYGSEAPNDTAAHLTRKVLRHLLDEGFEPSSLSPSSDGGLCVSFRKSDRYGDVECFNSGEVMAIVSDAGRDTEAWELSNSQVTFHKP